MSRRITRGFQPDVLVRARRDSGLTRGELARLAHVGIGTIQSWETGRAAPQVDSLVKVVAVLDLEISDVVVLAEDERYLGDLRVLRGMTQTELAKGLGISTTSLSLLELGHVLELRPEIAEGLARELGVSAANVRSAFHRTQRRPRETKG